MPVLLWRYAQGLIAQMTAIGGIEYIAMVMKETDRCWVRQ
jgi:hypothetical protein